MERSGINLLVDQTSEIYLWVFVLYLFQQIHIDHNFQQNAINDIFSKNNGTLCFQGEYTKEKYSLG